MLLVVEGHLLSMVADKTFIFKNPIKVVVIFFLNAPLGLCHLSLKHLVHQKIDEWPLQKKRVN